jgi:SynChlorMet cassette radical SAM/SPASM protein ScmF
MFGRRQDDQLMQAPPLNFIYFYLTDGCDLRCRHCWIAPKFVTEHTSPAFLDVGVIESIVRQAKSLGLTTVKLTGGEPLIHPQIIEILELVRREKIGLILETNGVNCTPVIARSIASCGSPAVSVSIDGADAQTHEWMRGVEGSFDAAVRGVGNLVDAGVRPQLIMSRVKRNKTQVEPLISLAESLGAESVRFNIVQGTARGERLQKVGETLSIHELLDLGVWAEAEWTGTDKIRVDFAHPIAFRPLHRLFDPNGNGCGTCRILNIIGVLADGSYALCGIGEAVPDLVFGHAERDKLRDVWRDTPVLRRLRQGLPSSLRGICGACLMKNVCLGSCIAMNYYLSSDLWAPFWYCEEAAAVGRFPETRRSPRSGGDEEMDRIESPYGTDPPRT